MNIKRIGGNGISICIYLLSQNLNILSYTKVQVIGGALIAEMINTVARAPTVSINYSNIYIFILQKLFNWMNHKEQKVLTPFCNLQTIQKIRKSSWQPNQELNLGFLKLIADQSKINNKEDEQNSQKNRSIKNADSMIRSNRAEESSENDKNQLNTSIINSSFQRKFNSQIKRNINYIQEGPVNDIKPEALISKEKINKCKVILTVSICYISKKHQGADSNFHKNLRTSVNPTSSGFKKFNQSQFMELNAYDKNLYLKINDERQKNLKINMLQKINENLINVQESFLMEIEKYKKQFEDLSNEFQTYKSYSEEEFQKIKELQHKIDQILKLNKKREDKLAFQINKSQNLVRTINTMKEKQKFLTDYIMKQRAFMGQQLSKKMA